MNIFELATREGLRFNFKGSSLTEDLWHLSIEQLDGIFKGLNAQAKQASEESLLSAKSDIDKILDLKIEIVKHIVAVKLREVASAKAQSEKAEKKQKLLEILANKQDDALNNMSEEELQKALSELG